MRSLFTEPRFTKKLYGDPFMHTGVIALSRYCVVPVGEMVVNRVSSTLGETVVFVTRVSTRPSTSASRPLDVVPVGQPFIRMRSKAVLKSVLAFALPASRLVPLGSFCRARMYFPSR